MILILINFLIIVLCKKIADDSLPRIVGFLFLKYYKLWYNSK